MIRFPAWKIWLMIFIQRRARFCWGVEVGGRDEQRHELVSHVEIHFPLGFQVELSSWICGSGIQKIGLGQNTDLVEIHFHHSLSQKQTFRLKFKLIRKAFKATSFAGTLFPYLNKPIITLYLSPETMLDIQSFLDPNRK